MNDWFFHIALSVGVIVYFVVNWVPQIWKQNSKKNASRRDDWKIFRISGDNQDKADLLSETLRIFSQEYGPLSCVVSKKNTNKCNSKK